MSYIIYTMRTMKRTCVSQILLNDFFCLTKGWRFKYKITIQTSVFPFYYKIGHLRQSAPNI